ncbi:MAG: IS4 family transposase [Candidatus Hydrogenedentota bacterium]
MVFAQLTGRESLRDIETCLRAMHPKLYHAGIRGHVSRSTLADANETRDWRIYADFAQTLITTARTLYAREEFGVQLAHTAYVFDSTTIDLCLALFPWAHFRRHKGAVKLHTLLDLHGGIPCFIRVTHAKTHDVTALDYLVLEPGSYYIMDRGYIDFARLYRFNEALSFFVVRSKKNLDYQRRACRPVDKTTGLRADQTIVLCGPKTSQQYPVPLRRITYFDSVNHTHFVFLANNFDLPALTIAQLYRCRWQVELFFKWVKQHLHIKSFYGTSENAVKTQIWIAVATYLLVAIIKKRLNLAWSLNEILQILSISLFENTPILQAFSPDERQTQSNLLRNQMELFNF